MWWTGVLYLAETGGGRLLGSTPLLSVLTYSSRDFPLVHSFPGRVLNLC